MHLLYKIKLITILLVISSVILGSCTNSNQAILNNTNNNEETKIEEINENEPTDQQIDELIDLIFEMEN